MAKFRILDRQPDESQEEYEERLSANLDTWIAEASTEQLYHVTAIIFGTHPKGACAWSECRGWDDPDPLPSVVKPQ